MYHQVVVITKTSKDFWAMTLFFTQKGVETPAVIFTSRCDGHLALPNSFSDCKRGPRRIIWGSKVQSWSMENGKEMSPRGIWQAAVVFEPHPMRRWSPHGVPIDGVHGVGNRFSKSLGVGEFKSNPMWFWWGFFDKFYQFLMENSAGPHGVGNS